MIIFFALAACTGTCLKREEMAQLVYNYEKVQEKYSGKTADVYAKIMYPELQLLTPGEHEHDDNARYEIILLDTDENGFRKGLEVKVMSDTSGCKIETQKQVKGDHWELVDTSSDTNDDVVKSDNSITFTVEGTGYITQYENDFDSSVHAVMTFRCKMDELPSQLRPGDEVAVSITVDVISEGEPITNAYMTCNLTVPDLLTPFPIPEQTIPRTGSMPEAIHLLVLHIRNS